MTNMLALNAGSGSQKVSLFAVEATPGTEAPAPLWEGYADWNEHPGSVMVHIKNSWGSTADLTLTETARGPVLTHLLTQLWEGPQAVVAGPEAIGIVGHRVVHGGPNYLHSARVTPAMKDAIGEYATVAGAHNHATLEGMAISEQLFGPAIPQVAAFDTTFHTTMPPAAVVYPGPYAWFEQGIRRYGFHGLSHHYAAERAAQLLGRDPVGLRLITCHLGGGASLAAIQDGQSRNTTMGFTPLEGLVMNNRSGTVDPGILLYLLEHRGYTVEQLDHELHEQSGLLGISGIANDLRALLTGDNAKQPRAQLAFDVYIHRLREGIGVMLATLGGLDGLVFTGGVGEHIAAVRSAACAPFAFLGLALDEERNATAHPDVTISAADARVPVLLIQAQEEWMIARACWEVVAKAS